MPTITVLLTYKREKEATPEELFEQGNKLRMKYGVDVQRVIFDGEPKNPWPEWLQILLESRGYRYEFFNQRYAKYINVWPIFSYQERLRNKTEAERLWQIDLMNLIKEPDYGRRQRLVWSVTTKRRIRKMIVEPDVKKCAELARVYPVFIDGYEMEIEKAEDVKKEEELFG